MTQTLAAIALAVSGVLLLCALAVPAEARADWDTGIEAPLPSGWLDPDVSVKSMSCPSAGNCSAVGSYAGSAGVGHGLVVSEKDGVWQSGIPVGLPADADQNQGAGLDSVSCTSAGNCTAVGSYNGSDQNQGLLVSEKDGVWEAGTEATLPVNATSPFEVSLSSVSCASAGNCSAVGRYTSTEGTAGLLLTQTDGVWGAGTQAVVPGDGVENLDSVSCASAGNCTVVGDYYEGSEDEEGLILTETDGVWGSGHAATLPGNANGDPIASLASVVCSAPGDCSAVGGYEDTSGGYEGLLLDESDGVWSSGTEAVLPSNAANGQPPGANTPAVSLNSVSCSSPGNCSAVGTYRDNAGNSEYFGNTQGLLIVQSGGAWGAGTEASLPSDTNANPHVELDNLSCSSAGTCTAVGGFTDDSGFHQGLVLNEVGGSWTQGIAADPPADSEAQHDVSLTAVSCASSGSCAAAGTYHAHPGITAGAVLDENAGGWGSGVEVSLPAGSGLPPENSVSAISCPSAGNCTAIGGYGDTGPVGRAMLLTQKNGVWTDAVEATMPSDAPSPDDSQFDALSCASVGNCTAVGYYVPAMGPERGLVLSETNGRWSAAVAAPLPPDAATALSAHLDAVSCPSPGNCASVGIYTNNAGASSGWLLSEVDGKWVSSLGASPPSRPQGGPQTTLSDVSCATPGNCTAVGSYADSSNHSESLIVTETNGVWGTGVDAPLPSNVDPGTPQGQLKSVSCASPANCSAVGSYDDSSGHQRGWLLSESDDEWSGIEAVTPGNAAVTGGTYAAYSRVASVSCASAGNCSAVGDYLDTSDSSDGLLLSENNGTWSTGTEADGPSDQSANPAGIFLDSVSCGSPGNCWATGHSAGPQGVLLTESGGHWGSAADPTSPGPTKQSPVLLNAVSCSHADYCAAAGSYQDENSRDRGFLFDSQPASSGSGTPSPPSASGTPASAFPPSKPTSTTAPVINGSPVVGRLLTALPGSWLGSRPFVYSYQWQRCSSGCSDIGGAVRRTYALGSADVGRRVRVVVRARNSAGSAVAESSQLGPVRQRALSRSQAAKIRIDLLRAITPQGAAASVRQLLRRHGYRTVLATATVGRAVMSWYLVPRGLSVTSPARQTGRKPVMVATASVRVHRVGRLRMNIDLTRFGTALLRHGRHLRLTAEGRFIPSGAPALVAYRTFRLQR